MIRPALIVLMCFSIACSSKADDSQLQDGGFDAQSREDTSPPDAWQCPLEVIHETPSPQQARGEVIGTGTYTLGENERTYELLRLVGSSGQATYAQWFPPLGSSRPAALIANPYDGIDWTGEAIDEQWAARCPSSCAGLDVNGPNYDHSLGPEGPTVPYTLVLPQKVADDMTIYLLHDVGVLVVFNRFYAGGTLWQHVENMVAGLRFFEQRDDVDKSRIGTYGSSLGGFEAFYAAAYAPEGARPSTVVSYFAPLDWADQERWITREMPANLADTPLHPLFERILDPYLRRLYAATGGPSQTHDYRCFDRSYIASRIQAEVLLVHDEHDALVPFSQSTAMAAELGDRAHSLYYRHENPPYWPELAIDHGPLLEEGFWLPMHTFGLSFLLLHITKENVIIPYAQTTLRRFFETLRDQRRAGLDRHEATARILELTDPRVLVFDLGAGELSGTGSEWVTREINAVWETNYSADTIAEVLRTQGLPQ